MIKNNFILSICIPTYNRESQLKRLLESIVNQEGFTNEVSIIIADGPSSDNTEIMVGYYIKKYKNIFYHRNKINIGMTKALLEVIAYSNGEYTWMVGSDDQLSNFSLKYMLNAVKQEKPKLLLSNLFAYKNIDEINKYSNNEKYIALNGFEKFADYIGTDKYNKEKFGYEQHFTFMSVFCFETTFFNQGLKKVVENKGIKYLENNYFNYIYVIYSYLKNNKIVLLEGDYILLNMTNTTMWKPNMKIFNDLKDLFNMINTNYILDNNFKRFEKKINDYIYKAMYKGQLLVPIIFILDKIGLYKNLSYLWRKYVLKTIK